MRRGFGMICAMSLMGIAWAQECRQWVWRNPLPQGNHLHDIIAVGDELWAVGDRGLIMNHDGTEWSIISSGLDADYYGIAHADDGSGSMIVGHQGVFVTRPEGGQWSEPQFMASSDGVLNRVAYGNHRFVAVGRLGKASVSLNGGSWTEYDTGLSIYLNDIIFVDSVNSFCAVGSDATLALSSDGVSWSAMTLIPGSTEALLGIEHADGETLVTGEDGTLLRSEDFVNWDSTNVLGYPWYDAIYWSGNYIVLGLAACTSPTFSNFQLQHAFGENMEKMVAFQGQLWAVGANGRLHSSADGITWDEFSSGSHPSIWGIAKGDGIYVAMCGDGTVLRSSDGAEWNQAAKLSACYAVDFFSNHFVAVGSQGLVHTSPDGLQWTTATSGTSEMLWALAHDAERCVAVGMNGAILFSQDLATWHPATAPPDAKTLFGLGHAKTTPTTGVFTAVGAEGEILTSPTGETWTRSTGAGLVSVNLRAVTTAGFTTVAVGEYGAVVRKSLSGWSDVSVLGAGTLAHVTFMDGAFSAFGTGIELTSTDGSTWTQRITDANQLVLDTLIEPGRTWIVGAGGMIIEAVTPSALAPSWPDDNILVLVAQVNSFCD